MKYNYLDLIEKDGDTYFITYRDPKNHSKCFLSYGYFNHYKAKKVIEDGSLSEEEYEITEEAIFSDMHYEFSIYEIKEV